MVRLGTTLLLAKYGVVGPWSRLVAPFIQGLIGLLIGSGVFIVDLTLDAYKEGTKLDEFKKLAKEAYDYAKKRVYTEEEKEQIRAQYASIISKFSAIN